MERFSFSCKLTFFFYPSPSRRSLNSNPSTQCIWWGQLSSRTYESVVRWPHSRSRDSGLRHYRARWYSRTRIYPVSRYWTFHFFQFISNLLLFWSQMVSNNLYALCKHKTKKTSEAVSNMIFWPLALAHTGLSAHPQPKSGSIRGNAQSYLESYHDVQKQQVSSIGTPMIENPIVFIPCPPLCSSYTFLVFFGRFIDWIYINM